MEWHDQLVEDILADMPLVTCTVRYEQSDRDYSLMSAVVTVTGCDDDALIITPFVEPMWDDEDEDARESLSISCDVERVEVVTKWAGDDGGCQTTNTDLGMVYGFLVARLCRLGFCCVAAHYDF